MSSTIASAARKTYHQTIIDQVVERRAEREWTVLLISWQERATTEAGGRWTGSDDSIWPTSSMTESRRGSVEWSISRNSGCSGSSISGQ